MGYYNDSRGARCFEPDDTEDVMYLSCGLFEPTVTLTSLLQAAEAKWPDGWRDLEIVAEHIHTEWIGFDMLDLADYTNYLKITRIKNGA